MTAFSVSLITLPIAKLFCLKASARARTEAWATHATAESLISVFGACRLLSALAVGRDLVGEGEHHISRHEVAE